MGDEIRTSPSRRVRAASLSRRRLLQLAGAGAGLAVSGMGALRPLSFLGASPAEAASVPAHRLTLWANADLLFGMSDDEIAGWIDLGIDGFACQTGRLPGFGGSDWVPAAQASNFVERCHDRGLKVYAACYIVNWYNNVTPLEKWFDNGRWNDRGIPTMRRFAGDAHVLGFDGLAFDGEPYTCTGGIRPTWAWSYKGNTASQSATRAKVEERGAQVMTAVVEGFPEVELASHYAYFPDTWRAKIAEEHNDIKNPLQNLVCIDFWRGITSVSGYAAVRFWDSIFYKSHQIRPHTWDDALSLNAQMHAELFARRWPHYPEVASKIHVSPFAWIDEGPADYTYDDARSPEHVTAQLAAFRRHGQGEEFAVYHNGSNPDFDYGPYREGMRSASEPPDE
jgi:hypothetical protein